MSDHTPTPWKRDIGNDCYKVRGPDHRIVAITDNPLDGTFIVRAVNSHAALIAALHAALDDLRLWKHASPEKACMASASAPSTTEIIRQAEAALALVEALP